MERRVLRAAETKLQETYSADVKHLILQNRCQNQEEANFFLPYFAHISKQNRSYNCIKNVKVDGNKVTDPANVEEEILKHYAGFYTARNNKPDLREDLLTGLTILD
jgi:hypothetical protein